MLLNFFQGFCMALADSVPGVSGGTVAFILGFYEPFLNAVHGLFSKDSTALYFVLLLAIDRKLELKSGSRISNRKGNRN